MPKKLTREEFIEKARLVHGDKYDYSKVDYVNNSTKVCIICSEHGEFWQTPKLHINQQAGCSKCSSEIVHAAQKSTKEEFIKKAIIVHGNKYDYSKAEYINSKTKMCIICSKHGEFQQTPNDHLRGKGCKQCGIEVSISKRLLSTEEFIEKARLVHGDKYDYSKVNYININKKISLICPEHGEFFQNANNHLNLKNGCPQCAIKIKSQNKTLSTEEFIEKARLVHKDKYNYSKINYINNHTKICIICSIHGEFFQTPNSHLNKNGCRECSLLQSSLKRSSNLENFISTAHKIHNHKYDYSKSIYIKNKKKIEIVCKKHGSFWQTPNSHLSGQGCPNCRKSKGENIIERWLKDHNLQYETQKRFKECKDKRTLPFDFYLLNYNICIEFDGNQHFNIHKIWHRNIDTFNKLKEHDKIKDQYCKENNIDLLRINYKQFKNIENILTKKIFGV